MQYKKIYNLQNVMSLGMTVTKELHFIVMIYTFYLYLCVSAISVSFVLKLETVIIT